MLQAYRGKTICCEALWQDDPRDEESGVLHHPPGLANHPLQIQIQIFSGAGAMTIRKPSVTA